MKKQILSILFILSISISFSQLITHTSVRVDDSERESYLELEEFWSKIHEQAVKDEYSAGWMLWEFTYKDDEEAEGKPDFLIMNFHKDSVQRQKFYSIDGKEYARKIHSNLSKRNFEKKWNLPRGNRNNYRLERLDNTNWISTLEKGNEIYLNVFKALNEDYESYEMEYFKKMAEKQIVNGTRKWWEFNKILSSSINTETSLDGSQTHVTIDMPGRTPTEEERKDMWENTSFIDKMMQKNGSASREFVKRYNLKLLMWQL
tara:strand:+ start:1889 stop:2668 length:780 start_codon:yes stop_codon:yes gene_type:complete